MTAPRRGGRRSRNGEAYTARSAVSEKKLSSSGAKPSRVEVPPPVRDLLARVVEVEERVDARWPPAGERAERPSERHDALGGAVNAGFAGESPLGIGELHAIDVDGDDLVLRRERHRRAAGRRDAQHAASGPEGTLLDRRVLVDAAEQHFARTVARVEAAVLPDGLGGARAHDHPGRLAQTHTSTRKAKFFTTMPAGS